MLEAFKVLGYEVDLITGYASKRKAAIQRVRENIKNGVKYDFMYAESSTMPTTLTEKHHLPTHPFLDWQFFRFCKKNNIPIGLFYRDIYWLFDEYGKGLNTIKVQVAKIAYKFDLWVYQQTITKLYLPSLKMGDYVSTINPSRFAALPPGHTKAENQDVVKFPDDKKEFKFFYVGGLGPHYQMHKWFQAVSKLPFIKFTLCTRESEWNAIKHEYEPYMAENIDIVHKSGEELKSYFLETDFSMLFVLPQEYREFAAPVKLFEYIGERKLILASNGTLAGQFVSENNLGWSVDYEFETVHDFLSRLPQSIEQLNKIVVGLNNVAVDHTWLKRAEKVSNDLKGNK
jgi:hypothetical protein